MYRSNIRAIHFIGVGGAGMAGLAEVMAGMGFAVSGSDCRAQPSLERLRARGISVHVGHDAALVDQADCAVYSSAVAADNCERAAAAARGIPVVPRAQMLGELMRFKPGIAVAGTHGKTTVSSLAAHILTVAGLSPTCVIGGRLLSGGSDDGGAGGAGDGVDGGELLGSGEYVIVEADESDASFLHLQPVLAVVTNIDDDHLEAFNNDFAVLCEAFESFLANLPFYGSAILCVDDAPLAALAKRIKTHRVVRYGLTAAADIRATELQAHGQSMTYMLTAPTAGGARQPMRVRALGRHNVLNALAATAVALEAGVSLEVIRRALDSFAGVGRRLQPYGNITAGGKRAALVDDYAHHPSEIRATLAALRAGYPRRRLLLIFQPHRYSRTLRLMDSLADALSAAAALILLPVYAAGEAPPPAPANSQTSAAGLPAALAKKLRRKTACKLADDADDAAVLLEKMLRDDDIVVCMGAGDIGALAANLKARYGGESGGGEYERGGGHG